MKLTKFDLKSKFALITGSGGLLGQEHALALLEVNANIILTDINKKKINLIRKKVMTQQKKSVVWGVLTQVYCVLGVLGLIGFIVDIFSK